MTRSPENIPAPLTPEQSADVIRYYHDNANREARENGWRERMSLGQAAARAALARHSLLPDGQPTLTEQEKGAGLKYILDGQQLMERPKKPEEFYIIK